MTQLSSHLRSVIDRISPEKDVDKLKSQIPRSLASAIPDPILYEHGLVGECNDLIFGFSLVGYATAKGLPEGAIPKILRICIDEIDKRGLECEGIYRASATSFPLFPLQLIVCLGFGSSCSRAKSKYFSKNRVCKSLFYWLSFGSRLRRMSIHSNLHRRRTVMQ